MAGRKTGPAGDHASDCYLREAATWFGPFKVQMLWPAYEVAVERRWMTIAIREHLCGLDGARRIWGTFYAEDPGHLPVRFGRLRSALLLLAQELQ